MTMETTTRTLRVLLVEDSPLLADRLQELITDIHEVESVGIVATENDARQLIESQQPDAVVLDLHLKQGSGFGVLRFVNSLPQRPRVVVMTNYALPQYEQQAKLLGARFFLDKAQEFDKLQDVLRTFQQEIIAA